MKFKIALTNSIWTPDYKNVRRFNSRADQEAYFDVENLFTESVPTRNVNFGSLLRVSVFVNVGEAGVENYMTNNYAIIKELATGKFYYYFILNSTFDAVTQVRLDLQLDVMQTYYLDMTFAESMIERAHLDRWSKALIGHTIFERGASDKFLVRDEIQGLPKRVKTVKESTTTPFVVSSPYSQFLKNNVYGWAYAFLDADTYTFDGETFNTQLWYEVKSVSANPPQYCSPFVVVCCPIMSNTTSHIQLAGVNLNYQDFFEFVNANKAHVYAMKFSQFSPFCRGSNAPSAIMPDDNTLNIQTQYNLLKKGTTKAIAVVQVQYLETQYLTEEFDLPQWNITKEGISTFEDDMNANPKSFNTDYRELKVVYAGGEYSFDIQKLYDSETLSASSVAFEGFEIITPEISPTFISVIPTNILEPVYNQPRKNRIGYVQENDLTMPFSKNQLEVFLANNKNFFAQKQLTYNTQRSQRAVSGFVNALSGLAGAAVSGVSGNVGGAVSGAMNAFAGIGTNILQSEISISYDEQNAKLTLDNMASGVDALANSNSNVFFTAALNDCKIMLVELEALPIDLGRALEDMHENGYMYNRMGNIKDFDNIRSKWNYVRAQLEIIKTPVKIPNEVREIVKRVFANGVRFWNTDDVRFNQTNLE